MTSQEAFLERYQDPKNLPRAIFLTGGAGTGKTYVVSKLLEQLPANFPYALAAPTGVAALNLGGVTLHSLLRIPFGLREPRNQAAYNALRLGRAKLATLKAMKLLILDEVSMIRADVLEYADQLLQQARGNDEPFGGLAILAIGDPFQLPPVVLRHENLPEPWFFQSLAWENLAPEPVILTHCYRQNDTDFINLLNSAREGSLSLADLRLLGNNINPESRDEQTITLSTLNRTVDGINNNRLSRLDVNQTFLSQAEVTLTSEASEKLKPLKQTPAVENLELRPDARIMMLNNDKLGRWVNGSLGTFRATVERNDEEFLQVELDEGGLVEVPRHTWELVDYQASAGSWQRKVLATVKQFPVRLGWALTVHKAQGLSLPNVHFQLDWVFESGQTYVALSRATSLAGLTISRQLRNKDIITSGAVKQFYQTLQEGPA